jgi:ribosomal protein S18 acetylase RimI-like enzyme
MRFSSIDPDGTDLFGRGGGTLPDIAPLVARLFAAGSSRPQWCWTATDEGRLLARAGLLVAEDPADVPTSLHPEIEPDLLAQTWSRLPYTLSLFGLAHVPGPAGEAAAGDLLRHVLGQLELPPRTVLEVRTNPEVHPEPAARCRLLEAAGFALFQEKHGYAWAAPSGPEAADDGRLTFADVAAAGPARFLEVMAAAGADTLDRNDRYYYDICRPRGWARVMLDFAEPETSFIGYDGSGAEVGFVAVSAFDEPETATIGHIGVLPGHRGQGYGRQLLAAGTRAAERAGYTAMLSDVDVHNGPMAAAMRAVGHRDDRRPWHIWHHRLVV